MLKKSMGRNKSTQIDEVKNFVNVFSDWGGKDKPDWQEYFGNDGKIIVEMGCGWGQYTLALAAKYPEHNFIGVDRKADRIWMSAKKALAEEEKTGLPGEFCDGALKNIAFLQIEAQNLTKWFSEGEVDEIWVTFPDPQPKPCKANKRLISPRFLEIYKTVCKAGATLHLKTDNKDFFDYSLDILEPEEVIWDVHGQDEIQESLKILTFYEQKFMAKGIPIKYLRVNLQ